MTEPLPAWVPDHAPDAMHGDVGLVFVEFHVITTEAPAVMDGDDALIVTVGRGGIVPPVLPDPPHPAMLRVKTPLRQANSPSAME